MTGTRKTIEQTAQTRPPKKGPEGGKAVERAATLLLELARHPRGISLSELARQTGTPLATLHRTVAILRAKDFIRETSTENLAVGVSSLVLAGAYLEGVDLRSEARAELEEISASTGETVHLGILSPPNIVYTDKIDSPSAVRMVSRVGGTNPAATTAIGKSILAHSPKELVDQVVASSRDRIDNVDRFYRELEVIRRRGYSTDPETNEPGIWCVAAPILDHTGVAIAGVSVSTPVHRFDPSSADSLGEYLHRHTQAISRRMGHQATSP